MTGRSGSVVREQPAPAATFGARSTSETLWWRWVAPASGQFTFDTHGSESGTVLTVLLGDRKSGRVVVRNDDDGDLRTSSVSFPAVEGELYAIRVDVDDPDEGLTTLSWRDEEPLRRTTMAPQATFPSIPVSANTGEKPQSKAWQHDGRWWTVQSTSALTPRGSWLWRLDAEGWTNVLHLSTETAARADALRVGDVTHVLLHGPASSLVSLQYDAASASYNLWPERSSPTGISMPGSETATIDMDSTGRLWVAYDPGTSVQVRWSDPPYSSFSSPITIASNITEDDIAMVVALTGRIGVLWSDQRTKRFGFRTHVDGSAPSSWTANEKPASQSALNVGKGMADDHLNAVVSADGTLYAAVKTSYDSTNHTTIGLLVRHPDGRWDDLHEVSRQGTRPIVTLNEAEGILHLFYTETEGLNDIHHQVTPRSAISFTGVGDELIDGSYNNVTSVKETWADDLVVLAAGASHASHAVIGEAPAPEPPPEPDPSVPVVVDVELSTVQGMAVQAQLEVAGGPVGGDTVFEVVDGPVQGGVELDAASGVLTYTPQAGVVGVDEFTFRAGVGGVWSVPASVRVRIMAEEGLVGYWALDEGAGVVAGDSSGWGGDGAVVGGAAWGPGVFGSGLGLDGVNDWVVVPDGPAVDAGAALTVSAWIRPEKVGTQYVVKKAAQHATDGYEVGLSSGGKVFLRLNQRSSGDTFRVDSTASYPVDGQTWMHVAGVYDGSRMRLFIDGVEQGSKPGPGSVASNSLDLFLGAGEGGFRPMAGGLDEVRLYSRALTAAQVSELMTQTEPGS